MPCRNKQLPSSLPCLEHALKNSELQPKFFSFGTHFSSSCLRANRKATQGSSGGCSRGCVLMQWDSKRGGQATPRTARGPGVERPLTEHVLWECLAVGMCLRSRPDSCAFSLHGQFRFTIQTSTSVW